MKVAWQNIFTEWKISSDSGCEAIVLKSSFSILLAKLAVDLDKNLPYEKNAESDNFSGHNLLGRV